MSNKIWILLLKAKFDYENKCFLYKFRQYKYIEKKERKQIISKQITIWITNCFIIYTVLAGPLAQGGYATAKRSVWQKNSKEVWNWDKRQVWDWELPQARKDVVFVGYGQEFRFSFSAGGRVLNRRMLLHNSYFEKVIQLACV